MTMYPFVFKYAIVSEFILFLNVLTIAAQFSAITAKAQ